MKKAGRPIAWTDDKKQKACETILTEISSSELGIDHICAADASLPSPSTFYEWLNEDDVLAERYARARELQAIYITDTVGVLATQLVAKRPTHSIDPQAFRGYMDAAKWRTAKLAPKTHGDKVDVTSGGKALPPPAAVEVKPEVLAEAMKKFKESL